MQSEDSNQIQPGKTIESLLRNVKAHDWTISWKTADELALLGAPAVSALIGALSDEDGYVRDVAAIALGKIGDKRAVEPLISAMRHRDERAYPDDEDQEARMSAATALGRIADPKSFLPLIETLRDALADDVSLSWYIIDALGMLGDQRAIPILKEALEHEDVDVRKSATRALRQIEERNERR